MENRFDRISNEIFVQAFIQACSKSELARILNLPINGGTNYFFNKMISKLKLDISILKQNYRKKYFEILICPVCGKEFETTRRLDHGRKVVCSRACSNTYFRSGINNGMWKEDKNDYRIICFSQHPHMCCICGEEKIVEVHHYDLNHENHAIENLIPLCPTHHQYYHSRYRSEVQVKIDAYRERFIKEHLK